MSVELRYRTRLLSFTQDADTVVAQVEDLAQGRRYEIVARYIAGCDGARSLVRETLGITMSGNPALTYTTNVIFRCPHLVSLHDKGQAYRFIILGPEGTWSTIVAINGRDQWRFRRAKHSFSNSTSDSGGLMVYGFTSVGRQFTTESRAAERDCGMAIFPIDEAFESWTVTLTGNGLRCFWLVAAELQVTRAVSRHNWPNCLILECLR